MIFWDLAQSSPAPSSAIHALRERTSSAYSGMLLERACPVAQTQNILSPQSMEFETLQIYPAYLKIHFCVAL